MFDLSSARKFMLVAAMPMALIGLSACSKTGEVETPVAEAPPSAEETTTEVAETADAAEPTAAELIEARQKKFKKMGKNFKTVMDNVKGGTPTSEDALAAIEVVAKMAPNVKTWFPEGTGPDAGVKTDAKSIIWDDPEGFTKAYTNLETAVAVLAAAGEASDGVAISAAFGGVGLTCKGCHDTYREED